MITRGRTASQMSYALACEALRKVLGDALRAGPGEDGVGSVALRGCAALYALLLDHPVDRRGRCRSCRRPGVVIGLRRRRCRVLRAAHFALRQSGDFLASHLAGDLGLPAPPVQTPAAPPPPILPGGFPTAGRPDPERGGAGERPDRPRSRRAPPDDNLSRSLDRMSAVAGTGTPP